MREPRRGLDVNFRSHLPFSCWDWMEFPVIDVFRAGASEEIIDALHTVGFFYASIPSDLQESCDTLLESSRQFFGLPLEVKQRIALKNFRGYSSLGAEQTLGLKDWHECVDWMSDQKDPSLPFAGVNEHPNEIPKHIVDRYMRHCSILAYAIVEAICSREFTQSFGDPFAILRLLRYPAQPQDAPGIGIGAHSDYGCVTLLQADAPGLQVLLGEHWVSLPPRSDAFAVNIGDALASLTGLKATRHRVIASAERTSIAYFFEPNLASTPFRHRQETYGSYLLSKYVYSFPDTTPE